MKRSATLISSLFVILFLTVAVCTAEEAISPDVQAKIDAKVKGLQAWGSDPTVVAAVKEFNSNPSAEAKAMTNDKWKTMNIMSPFVRSLVKNPLVDHLKTMKDDTMTEIFVSGADGGKVGFLAKTSSWTHKGKEKHDVPMTGKSWQGKVEVDESTGKQQVQVSLPVLDNGTPIGSIVVGLGITKL